MADKREIEYQSGRKLQYKSACYFFRIDTEHIIDATLKGGIARFVNHSCLVIFSLAFRDSLFKARNEIICFNSRIFDSNALISNLVLNFFDQPNCVAKVISVRNEKKVTRSSPMSLHIFVRVGWFFVFAFQSRMVVFSYDIFLAFSVFSHIIDLVAGLVTLISHWCNAFM